MIIMVLKNDFSDRIKDAVIKAKSISELEGEYKKEIFTAVLINELIRTNEKIINRVKESHTVSKSSLDKKDIPYKKGTTQYYVYLLINSDKFFVNNQIRTTEEIVKKVKLRYDKKIEIKKAAQLLATLVKDGVLERDRIKTRGREGYIWFLPQTPIEKIENFKKRFLK